MLAKMTIEAHGLAKKIIQNIISYWIKILDKKIND